MPCIHNQALISDLENQIQTKTSQINNIDILKTEIKEMISNHNKYVENIDCVVKNLEGNSVIANRQYDNGDMAICMDEASEEILRCEAILKISDAKISLLEQEINNLRTRINSLQGDCSNCIAAAQASTKRRPNNK